MAGPFGQSGNLGPISEDVCIMLSKDLNATSDVFFRVIHIKDAEKSELDNPVVLSKDKTFNDEISAIKSLHDTCVNLWQNNSSCHIICNLSRLSQIFNDQHDLEPPFDKLKNIKRTPFIITISRPNASTKNKMGLSLSLTALTNNRMLSLHQNKQCQYDSEEDLNFEAFLDRIKNRVGSI